MKNIDKTILTLGTIFALIGLTMAVIVEYTPFAFCSGLFTIYMVVMLSRYAFIVETKLKPPAPKEKKVIKKPKKTSTLAQILQFKKQRNL